METLPMSNLATFQIKRPIHRVALACIQCRSRKVKCDATQPACIRCNVDGKQCEYQKSRRGGRPRRPVAATSQTNVDDRLSILGSPDERIHTSTTRTNSSNSQCSETSESSAHGVSETVSPEVGLDLPDTRLTSIQVDQLLSQYYIFFHTAHPCVLPQWSLRLQATNHVVIAEILLPVLLYIGSIFTPSIASAPLADAAILALNEPRTRMTSAGPFYVQALMMYSIAVYWCDESEKGRELLDKAIQIAFELGMHKADFAIRYGEGDPVLEESWRRTWWQLYITDAHIAGSTHSFPTMTGSTQITAGLPCEEAEYESGCIPTPPTLRSYDMREFSDMEFSSFAQLVGFTVGVNRTLATKRLHTPDHAKVICANADTTLTAWCSLLPKSKRRILRDDGTIDELLFKANILMHTYIVDLHRELSSLRYSPIESVSKCAPPPPTDANIMMEEDTHVHTAKVISSVTKLNDLLTLPTRFATHTPFIICMIANITIAHLSACWNVFGDPSRLQLERDKIRLNMGVLKMMGEFWPAGKREYHDLGIIAKEILSLADEEIRIPETNSMMPLNTLDLNLSLDVDWACDAFTNGDWEYQAEPLIV